MMLVAYFFAEPIINYSKLIEAQSKVKSPSAYSNNKRK